jgi:hypothetical protein
LEHNSKSRCMKIEAGRQKQVIYIIYHDKNAIFPCINENS